MNRTFAALLVAVLAAALWLLWSFEHEHTRIRAPWTGLTLAASAAGFVAVGIVGRGWRGVAFAAGAAAAAVLLVDPLIWRSEPAEPGTSGSCDPGCISREAAVVLHGAAGCVLASIGISVRRAFGVAKRGERQLLLRTNTRRRQS